MTAIYAYASKDDKFGVIATDNLEANRQVKVEKIRLIDKRFAIAVFGLDIITHALDVIIHLSDSTIHKKFKSHNDLLHNIIGLMRYYRDHTHDDVKKKNSKAKYDLICKNTPGVVLLDCKTFELYHAQFFGIYPPNDLLDKTELIPLKNNTLYPFALAKNAELDKDKIINSTIGYFKKKINLDKKINPAGHPVVGDLGSVLTIRNKKISSRSCYSSQFEILDEFIKYSSV